VDLVDHCRRVAERLGETLGQLRRDPDHAAQARLRVAEADRAADAADLSEHVADGIMRPDATVSTKKIAADEGCSTTRWPAVMPALGPASTWLASR